MREKENIKVNKKWTWQYIRWHWALGIKNYIIKCYDVMATLDGAVRKVSSKKLTYELINVKFNEERVTDWQEQIN